MRFAIVLSSVLVALSVSSAARADGDRALHSPGLATAGAILGTLGAVGVTTGTYFALTHEACPAPVSNPNGPATSFHAACVSASDVPAELGVIGLIAGGSSFLLPAIPMLIVGFWPVAEEPAVTVELDVGRTQITWVF